ncbi:MAG TPA: PilN domain-containing protein [Longimicrobiales bacterium]
MRTRALRRCRLALIIAPGAVTAVELRATWRGVRAGRVAECEVRPPAADGSWPELDAALGALVTERRLAGCTADLLLARPFAHAKVTVLPPVRARDRRPLLQRSARRWFPLREEAVAAEVLPLSAGWRPRQWLARRGGDRAGVPAIALVAPEAVVEAAAAAAERAGLRVGLVAPVSVALAAFALARAGRRDRSRGFALVARGARWAERIVVQGGAPRVLQPLRVESAQADGITVEVVDHASDAAGPGSVQASEGPAAPRAEGLPAASGDVLQGPETAARAAPRAEGLPAASDDALQGSGIAPAQAPPARMRRARGLRPLEALPAAAAAALGAASGLRDQPLLLPATLREAWTGRLRRRVLARTAAAAAMLALAAAVHLRGLEMELAAVQAARRAVAPAAAEARRGREAAAAVRAMLAEVRDAERAAPHWPELFAHIADALPDSAHLVSFRAQDGGLRLAGLAASAAATAAALATSRGLEDVALAGPVRPDGASGRERFELTARPMAPDSTGRGRSP